MSLSPAAKVSNTLKKLLESDDPAIVYKIRTGVFAASEADPEMVQLRDQIRYSPVARQLMQGTASPAYRLHPYTKWQGAHWRLACLAEIAYPPGEAELIALRDLTYQWLFSDQHLKPGSTVVYRGQEDRVRRCASQEAYAVWYLLKLGLDDERTGALVERLKRFQWPDGGWNCDKRIQAHISSFIETWLPVRALALHGEMKNDSSSREAAARGAEFLLERRLLWRRSTGQPASPAFMLIQYPYYYIYNLLSALTLMAEAGLISDPRCRDALDLLESKRLPGGAFPLERKNWKLSSGPASRGSSADWGPGGKTRPNDWVTVEALAVLKKAGRLAEAPV